MAKLIRGPVEKELAKQVQRLLRNIKRRLLTISSKGLESPATNKFISMVESGVIPLSTRNLSRMQLINSLRNLKYIQSLKTSYTKGARQWTNKIKPIFDRLVNNGITSKNDFFKLYNKLVEENALLEKYKYDVWDIIEKGIENGEPDEVIRNKVMDLLNEIYNKEEVSMEDIITF